MSLAIAVTLSLAALAAALRGIALIVWAFRCDPKSAHFHPPPKVPRSRSDRS